MRTTNVRILSPNRNSGTGNGFDGYRLTKKRVAAYCRVSSDSIDQKSSYEAQVDEYTKRITTHLEWEMVKVYADEGISGTSTKNRKQFNEIGYSKLVLILQERYINCRNWEDISLDHSYSQVYLFKLHNKAIRLIRYSNENSKNS